MLVLLGSRNGGHRYGASRLPFGDPARRCPCGAHGCWDLEVDGRAMARTLAWRTPRNPRTAGERILADAGRGDPAASAAVRAATAAFGRGVAALVNAMDPDLVTISGLVIGLAEQAPATLERAYRDALMRFRRRHPPPLVASALGSHGILTGAAEVAFDTVRSDHGLCTWTTTRRGHRH